MSSKIKKFVYISMWIIVGVLLTILFTGFVDLLVIRQVSADPAAYMQYWDIAWIVQLVIFVFFGAILAGICGWVAPKAYKKIYVDGARGQKYVVKGNSKGVKGFEDLNIDSVLKWTATIFMIYLMIVITVILVTIFAFGIKSGLEWKGVSIKVTTSSQ